MKREEWQRLIRNFAQEDESEQRHTFYRAQIKINGLALEDLAVLQQRFGTENLAETLESCIALAKLVSDKVEKGEACLWLKRTFY